MSEYFTGNPIKLDTSRSKYHVSPRWTGTFNPGQLIPIFATSSVLPGDTFKMRIASVIRSITPVAPVMDDLDISVECYFVPHHLIMSREYMAPSVNDSNRSWSAFIGAQDSLLNMPLPGTVELPHVEVSTSKYLVGGVADCLGFPKAAANYEVNFLKFAAYYSVWNEYFRDPNTMSPVTYSLGSVYSFLVGTDANVTSDFANNSVASNSPCAPVCRYHGYFGSALPWPQRNSTAVTLPLGTTAPVLIGSTLNSSTGNLLKFGLSGPISTSSTENWALGDSTGQGGTSGTFTAMETTGIESNVGVNQLNLYTDLSTATAATINQVRLMFQTQRWYEQLARSGNREGEVTFGMFGVRGNDEGLKRPEYLGGKRIPLLQSQVASTGSAAADSSTTRSLGSTGAFSLTNDEDYYFTKSFTTWGTLMVVACVRARESFSEGLDREDSRFDRFDFYWPQFANLGEQPVRNKELVVTGTASADNGVFGYQEAWAEYRMFNDHVTGYMRPQVSGSLGYMTYANDFGGTAPTLKGYLDATSQKPNIARTLQVPGADFFFYGQFLFDIDMVRPMPLYSIPGLIDHH